MNIMLYLNELKPHQIPLVKKILRQNKIQKEEICTASISNGNITKLNGQYELEHLKVIIEIMRALRIHKNNITYKCPKNHCGSYLLKWIDREIRLNNSDIYGTAFSCELCESKIFFLEKDWPSICFECGEKLDQIIKKNSYLCTKCKTYSVIGVD